MRMKMSKSQFLWMIPAPGYKSWLLTSAVALLLLFVRLSQVSDDRVSIKKVHARPRIIDPSKGPNAPPILAYWILGTRGENVRMMRLLKAIYHPRNHYLLQLDAAASHRERLELSILSQSEEAFDQFGNVDVVGKSYAVNPMAASGLAAVLHAAALLLRLRQDWDWFVPLSTSDYPIFTQDDILYAFSFLPKDVIFMGYKYNNDTSLEKRQNVSQIVVDTSLHLKKKSAILYAAETREKPDAFEIFGGSPWMVLSRGLLEHCVNGVDNLPRKLLMYFNNVVFPLESYFQTVLCNTPNFQNTLLVNNDLRHNINIDVNVMDLSYSNSSDLPLAIYATPFAREDDPQLQKIDEKLLKRSRGRLVPGKWCNQTCSQKFCSIKVQGQGQGQGEGDIDIDSVQPSDEGIKLQEYFVRAVKEKKTASSQCRNYVMH